MFMFHHVLQKLKVKELRKITYQYISIMYEKGCPQTTTSSRRVGDVSPSTWTWTPKLRDTSPQIPPCSTSCSTSGRDARNNSWWAKFGTMPKVLCKTNTTAFFLPSKSKDLHLLPTVTLSCNHSSINGEAGSVQIIILQFLMP